MAVFEIPTGPSQRIETVVLNGVSYGFGFTYADAPDGGWIMDIADAAGNPLVCGIPLVTGCDLLAPFAYLGIGGKLFVATDGDSGAVPTYDSLGVTTHLFWEYP